MELGVCPWHWQFPLVHPKPKEQSSIRGRQRKCRYAGWERAIALPAADGTIALLALDAQAEIASAMAHAEFHSKDYFLARENHP